MKLTVIPIVIDALGTIPKALIKETSRDYPYYNIIKIGQNTEKSPGDLLSLKLQWETIS